MKIAYGKIGRSMPLTLEKCGTLGGDVEMAAVITQLATRHPDDDFYLVGRNTGEDPQSVGLPANVMNPWNEKNLDWARQLRGMINRRGLNHPSLSVNEQQRLIEIFYTLGVIDLMTEMDAHIWWVGQHGTVNRPLPMIKDRDTLAKPHDAMAYYSGWVFEGINRWRDHDPLRREEIYLNADPRNSHKMRDLKWPLQHPVITQYDYIKRIKHERDSDARLLDKFPNARPDTRWKTNEVWESDVRNHYFRLEINGLAPGTPFGDLLSFNDRWDGRQKFGLFINEARSYVTRGMDRKAALRDWVLPTLPYFIHGKWSQESLDELGVDIQPAAWEDYIPKLQSVLCTFTTPSSGSGWATTKPWEAFAAGTVCFFHPEYDRQGHILRDAPDILKDWLRVRTPAELQARIHELSVKPDVWGRIIRLQRAHFDKAMKQQDWMQEVEKRIYT